MPLVSTELDSAYYEPVATGPVALCDLSANAACSPPATIAASGNYTSAVMTGDGFKVLSAAVTSTQAGAISIQRYLDAAGTIAQGAAVSTSLTASTPGVVNVTDGLPYRSFVVKITNTGGATATISGYALLLSAS